MFCTFHTLSEGSQGGGHFFFQPHTVIQSGNFSQLPLSSPAVPALGLIPECPLCPVTGDPRQVLRMTLSLCLRDGHYQDVDGRPRTLAPSPISPTFTLSTDIADSVLWARSSLGAGCEQQWEGQVLQVNPRVRGSRRQRQRGAERRSAHVDSRREVIWASPQTLSVGFPEDWLRSQCPM